jgi:cytochrome d ubiquinol oxidase subunit II
MIIDYDTLKVIWWVFIAALLIGFALTDGYDMGGGILLPFLGKTDTQRRVLLNTLAPHWDGNQVWFITGAAGLFAAWPPVYAAAFSTFYYVLLATLYALLLRPGSFEYRGKIEDPRWRRTWDWLLFAGSAYPALIFGAAFGNLLLGVPFTLSDDLRPTPAGSLIGQFHPFALLAGVVGFSMLVVHGAVYYGLRTEGELRQRADRAAKIFAGILIGTFIVAGLWLGFGIDGYRIVSIPPLDTVLSPLDKTVEIVKGAWLTNYANHPWTIIAPLAGVLGAIGVILTAGKGEGRAAFVCSALSIVGVVFSAGISLFPFIMPNSTNPNQSLTIWDATSSYMTLTLMFWVTVIFLPIVLAYTFWAFRVMWRRITEETIQQETKTLY